MSQSLLVAAKNDKKGAKGQLATTRHSLSPTTTKDEFVALLKDINDRPLFLKFLRSQRKFLENKGLVNQFDHENGCQEVQGADEIHSGEPC